jgi:hypothetical protein
MIQDFIKSESKLDSTTLLLSTSLQSELRKNNKISKII